MLPNNHSKCSHLIKSQIPQFHPSINPTMNPPISSSQQQQSIFPKHSLLLSLPILLTPLILFQLQSSNPSSSPSIPPLFLPLKNLHLSQNPMSNNTWFMSSLPDTSSSPGNPSYIHLLSPSHLLCLSASNPHDGSRNSYTLASPQSLPPNSTLLPGLTFVSETFYDHHNLWHGLAAILPFAAWHAANGCAAPERWALFHWGEARRGMGMWVGALAEVSTGGRVRVLVGGEEEKVVCFEEAVVVRRDDGGMSGGRKREVYDMMRCRAREFCGLGLGKEEVGIRVGMTLLFRVGLRSFRNETAVKRVFERECGRVEGCQVRVVRAAANLTFCDQVWANYVALVLFDFYVS